MSVKLLIAAGANVNIANRYQNTPIHIAAMNGQYTIAEILVDSKADIMRINYVSKRLINANRSLKHV